MADMPSISIRKSIRWGDEAAGENTSTLVLTTGSKYYVDVRVFLPSDPDASLPNEPNEAGVLDRLEWAFAGHSSSTPAEYVNGELTKPAHTIWSHWVDSKTLEEVKDEGYMWPQADGSVLEKGAMAHPQTNQITPYEEIWQDLDPQPTGNDEKRACIVLQLDDPAIEARGVVIRIGTSIQGVLRRGDKISVVRWEWTQPAEASPGRHSVEGWQRTLAIGPDAIPCKVLFGSTNERRDGLTAGELVHGEDDSQWVCIEAFFW